MTFITFLVTLDTMWDDDPHPAFVSIGTNRDSLLGFPPRRARSLPGHRDGSPCLSEADRSRPQPSGGENEDSWGLALPALPAVPARQRVLQALLAPGRQMAPCT
jgi:hypothetical protein